MDETPIVQLASESEPATPKPEPSKSFDWTRLILPGAIILAGLMVSGSILYQRYVAGVNGVAQIQNQAPTANKKVNLDLSAAPSLGNPNAPVTIVEFGDFQCPFCERYFQSNQPQFISQYVNSGKARFVWVDYAFLGQESLWAAEAARCANDQGKFWPYHDYLYNHQGSENSGTFTKANLEKFAVTLGLNSSQFNSCLSSDKYANLVQQETQQGSSAGVSGTPSTFINGYLVVDSSGNSVGAAPFSTFQTIIDKDLNNK